MVRQSVGRIWLEPQYSVHQIESGLHGRQGKALTNFSRTLPSGDSNLAEQILKDPKVSRRSLQ
jgi:hypothetical protein